MDYQWSTIGIWTPQTIILGAYPAVPLTANSDATKERGKDKSYESGIDDSSRPPRYNYQHEPSKIQHTSLFSSDSSYLEHEEKEGKQQVDAGSRFLARLRAKASIGILRTNARSDIVVERQPKSRTLLKKRKRGKREKLNRQDFSLSELVGNSPLGLTPGVILPVPPGDERLARDDWSSPTSHPLGDVPFTPPSTGTPIPESPSSPTTIDSHPPSSFEFPSRSDSYISRPPSEVPSYTTTAPPYPYYRVRCDTHSSTQSYETLPGYQSRRSTPVSTDPDVPLPMAPRTKIRPLPPVPSVPPFVS
ncbi:hypothetical protein PM082_009281 [Marasmius tenuissimus]|nr:hypothetical protein PM082_009281 [Marasmius tenuissimus]